MSSPQNLGHYQNHCRQLKKETNRNDTNKDSNGKNISNNTSGQTDSDTHNNKTVSNDITNSVTNRNDRKSTTVYPPCETCSKTNHSTENCYFGANAANRPPPRNKRLIQQSKFNNKTHRSMQLEVSRLRPKL